MGRLTPYRETVGDAGNQQLAEILLDIFRVDICVHTPWATPREPDISAIEAVGEALVSSQRPGQLIMLTSTSYPGTTEAVLRPILERSGLVIGEDVFLASAPERLDPTNRALTLQNTPKLVRGVNPASTEMARMVLSTMEERWSVRRRPGLRAPANVSECGTLRRSAARVRVPERSSTP